MVNRTVKSNKYSFIPLHIMTEYAITKRTPLLFDMINEDYPLNETSSILKPTAIKTTISVDLMSIKKRLDQHIQGAVPMQFTNADDQEMLRVIRTNYMHTSAHYNDKIFGVYAPHHPDSDYITRSRETNQG